MKTVRWFALLVLGNLAAIVPASMAFSAPAIATAPVSTDAVTIAQSTVDGVDYVTREITIQPGGSTGWHYHDGRVFGVVREGTLTRTMADCTDVVSPEGAAVTEDSGPTHVHIGRNLGPVPVKLWIDYVQPAGTPLAVDVPDPGCGL
ncbi:MAG TPA: cupin domain-containing protein [Mycobacterium sp.]|jgi:quercetin dioxygenase-like cupin family protein|nr:cupin domain-containing protein [Mycobacterium sp.]